MKRREFIQSAAVGAAGVTVVNSAAKAMEKPKKSNTGAEAFKLKYAPHFGMFKHHAGDDFVDFRFFY